MNKSDRNVLQSNHLQLVDTLDLARSSVLDKLLATNLITFDEKDKILKRGTRIEQNAHLLFILNRKDDSLKPFDSFLAALSGEYDFLVKTLSDSRNRLRKPKEEKDTLCTHCSLLKSLVPNRMAHRLFHEKIISDDDLEQVTNNNLSHRDSVVSLLHVLETRKNTKKTFDTFRLCVTEDLPSLTNISAVVDASQFTSCRCLQNSKTTSSVYLSECETDMVQQSNKRRLFHEMVNSRNTKRMKSEAECNTDMVQPTNKRRQFQEMVNVQKSKGMKSETTFQLCRNVQKLSPCKSLMRQCIGVYHKLFFLRETGQWNTHDTYLQEAAKTFSDNPEVKLILLRDQISVATLYKADQEKAETLFEKAMTIIPKSSIPCWHQVRFLAAQVGSYSRIGRNNQANLLLHQAHQLTQSLDPYIGSAALNLFEAFHLAKLLRCTGNKTKSAKSLREKAENCFLTSARHYREDEYFELKSFSNQVYLYLAMFALGVDFKNIGFSSDGSWNVDLELAEQCLKFFEERWEESTNWSRMLFFVARAEQHKQISNLSRCIDYMKDARKYARKGCFEKQKEEVEAYLKIALEKYEERTRVKSASAEAGNAMLDTSLESSGESS